MIAGSSCDLRGDPESYKALTLLSILLQIGGLDEHSGLQGEIEQGSTNASGVIKPGRATQPHPSASKKLECIICGVWAHDASAMEVFLSSTENRTTDTLPTHANHIQVT